MEKIPKSKFLFFLKVTDLNFSCFVSASFIIFPFLISKTLLNKSSFGEVENEIKTKCLAEYSKRIFSTFSSYFLSKLEYNSSKRITGRSKESKIDNENRVFLALSRFS